MHTTKVTASNHPSHEECIALLKETETPRNIFLHARKVQGVALFLAERLNEHGVPVNVENIRIAGILHDIKKFDEIKKECGAHEDAGADLLIAKGFSEIAAIVRAHKTSNIYNGFNSWEERILYYADKRVLHDNIISIDERLEDGARRYPVLSKDTEKIRLLLHALEDQIFKKIGLRPENINEKTIEPYLCEDVYS
ncbi:MAG: HD domain-containing protein [Candidatus Woesearchaeota archaeon]